MSSDDSNKAPADRFYLFGQKQALIAARIVSAGAAGVPAIELCYEFRTSRRSVSQMMGNVCREGTRIVGRRVEGGEYRYFVGEHAPKSVLDRNPRHVFPYVARVMEEIRRIVGEAGQDGVNRTEIEALAGTNTVQKAVGNLKRAGELHATAGNQIRHTRLFARLEWADAYQKRNTKPLAPRKPKAAPQQKKAKERVPAKLHDPRLQRAAAHWSSLPSKSAPQKVVIPAGVKTKVLPSAPVYARHQLTHDAIVPCVVSSAECRPWVLALEGARP